MLFFLKTVKRITVCVSDDYLISRIFALVKVCNDQGKDQSHLHAVTLFSEINRLLAVIKSSTTHWFPRVGK